MSVERGSMELIGNLSVTNPHCPYKTCLTDSDEGGVTPCEMRWSSEKTFGITR